MANAPTTQDIASYYGAPITQDYNPPTEFGVDIGLPANAPVKLLVGGTYQAQYSTNYNSVFAVPGGYEDIAHIDPAQLSSGQQVAAGTVIGTVDPFNGTVISTNPLLKQFVATNPFTGGKTTYTTGGPHIEVGYYTDPSQAGNSNGPTAMNPAQLLVNSQQMSSAFPIFPSSPASPGVSSPLPAPTTPDQPTVGSPTGVNVPSPFNSINDLIKKIPADIGKRITVILIALALILIGGIVLASNYKGPVPV